jgi:hypothetical protein
VRGGLPRASSSRRAARRAAAPPTRRPRDQTPYRAAARRVIRATSTLRALSAARRPRSWAKSSNRSISMSSKAAGRPVRLRHSIASGRQRAMRRRFRAPVSGSRCPPTASACSG